MTPITQAALGLQRADALLVFPEGARSFDGELKEFKKGVAILAGEIGVPIVPVGIWGTYQVWPRDSRRAGNLLSAPR